MATNYKRMDEIRRIIESYLASKSLKETARKMNVSRNTVKKYIRLWQSLDMKLEDLNGKDGQEVHSLFYESPGAKEIARELDFESRVKDWVSELRKKGVTRYLLWEEYIEKYPEGYRKTQFYDRLRRYIKASDLTLALSHDPGEKAMIDFAGSKVAWHDSESGLKRWAEVLVVVLPHSHYTFAIALESQKTGQFLHGLNKALAFFGGTPQILLSDNLRSYVKRADRYSPDFTELSVQLSVHYQVELQATRVARPKDKGSVENMVSTVYNRLYGPLRHRRFYSIDQINEAFIERLELHNNTPYQKKEGCRKSVFEKYEKPLLGALPDRPFEIKKQTRAKIQNNYHAFLGEDKNYYSVHYKYVGKQVEMVYSEKLVEIYFQGKRIALHKRIKSNKPFQYYTQQEHKPSAHQIYDKIKNYQDDHFLNQADQIGVNTSWAIEYILAKEGHKELLHRNCLGVLHLAKKYSPPRLEKACLRCKQVKQVSYKMLRNILEKNLEEEQGVHSSTNIVKTHNNIRGAKSYQ